MPWLCLERCSGNTSIDITSQLASLSTHTNIFSTVSFEHYGLGPNGHLVVSSGLTDVRPQLRAAGFKLLPMISSYPYPVSFIDWMRQMFDNQTIAAQFMDACIEEAQSNGYAGWNIDWEPLASAPSPPTPSDAAAYAQFLHQFALKLWSSGLVLTVDIASWSQLYDFTLLNDAFRSIPGSRLITMDTYATNSTSWDHAFSKAIGAIDTTVLGVGLMLCDDSTGTPLPIPELERRLNVLNRYQIEQIDVSDMFVCQRLRFPSLFLFFRFGVRVRPTSPLISHLMSSSSSGCGCHNVPRCFSLVC